MTQLVPTQIARMRNDSILENAFQTMATKTMALLVGEKLLHVNNILGTEESTSGFHTGFFSRGGTFVCRKVDQLRP